MKSLVYICVIFLILDATTTTDFFREVVQDGMFVFIPASNLIRIFLQYSLTRRPPLNEFIELLLKN